MLNEIYASCFYYWRKQGSTEAEAKHKAIADVERMNNAELLAVKSFYLNAIEFWEEKGFTEQEATEKAFQDVERVTIQALIPVFPFPISAEAKAKFLEHKLLD